MSNIRPIDMASAQSHQSSRSDSAEFVAAMRAVAIELQGEPNAALSSQYELRFGNRGSLSVDLIKGTYFDNDAKEGGGLIKFVMVERRLDKAGARAWLQERGHITKRAPSQSKRIVTTYDYLDAGGNTRFQVVRYEPKDFKQRRPEGNGWTWKVAVKKLLDGTDASIDLLPGVTLDDWAIAFREMADL
jgi:hypothetical protein